MGHVFASIDIGSDSIKVVVCEIYGNRIFLLACSNVPSFGVKKGLIIDAPDAKKAIRQALDDAEEMLGIKIERVICSVPSHFLNYKVISGKVKPKGNVVTGEDMFDSFADGIDVNLPAKNEFVSAVPVDFKIDDKIVKNDPKNYPCQVLAGRAMMVSCPKKNLYSVASLIEDMGVELVDVCTSSLGLAASVNDKLFTDGLSAIINIGLEITEISIYKRGIPAITKIIGIGGEDIDREISAAYRITLSEARRIKEEFGVSYAPHASKSDYVKVQNKIGKDVKITQYDVSEIISKKIEEILVISKNELESLTNHRLHYIMVTGGVSDTSDFEYSLKNILPGAKVGKIGLVGARSNKYSVAIGNIMYFSNTLKLKEKDYSMFSEREMDLLSSPNDNSNTVLGKVFSYFFGE